VGGEPETRRPRFSFVLNPRTRRSWVLISSNGGAPAVGSEDWGDFGKVLVGGWERFWRDLVGFGGSGGIRIRFKLFLLC
jgi:hypothetical protein